MKSFGVSGCPSTNDGRGCTKTIGHNGSCRFIGVRESTKRARGVTTPDGIDVGTVVLVMNAISALAALPVAVSATFWWCDYGASGEYAFRAWVAHNGHSYALDDESASAGRPSVSVVRKSDRRYVATFRVDLPSDSHDCHPLHPDRARSYA